MRIAKIMIIQDHPNFRECGMIAEVAPTPLDGKDRPNSHFGVWVYALVHAQVIVVFVPIGYFQVLRYVTKPRAEQYGFVSSFKYPSLQNSMWSGNEGKILFFKHRLEYDNLA